MDTVWIESKTAGEKESAIFNLIDESAISLDRHRRQHGKGSFLDPSPQALSSSSTRCPLAHRHELCPGCRPFIQRELCPRHPVFRLSMSRRR